MHSTLLSPLSDHGCSPTLKNYEGSEIVLSLKANKLAATVSWMLAEDTGLLGLGQKTSLIRVQWAARAPSLGWLPGLGRGYGVDDFVKGLLA